MKKLLLFLSLFIVFKVSAQQTNWSTSPSGWTSISSPAFRFKANTPDSLNSLLIFNPLTGKYSQLFTATELLTNDHTFRGNLTFAGISEFLNNAAMTAGHSFTVGDGTNGTNFGTSTFKIFSSGKETDYGFNLITNKNLGGGFQQSIQSQAGTFTQNSTLFWPFTGREADTLSTIFGVRVAIATAGSGYFLNIGGNTVTGPANEWNSANDFFNPITIKQTGLSIQATNAASPNAALYFQNGTSPQLTIQYARVSADDQLQISWAGGSSAILFSPLNNGQISNNGNTLAKNTNDPFGIINSNASSFASIGVGTGSTSLTSKVQIVETATTADRGLDNQQYSSDGKAPRINSDKFRGTFASPSTILTGDSVLNITGRVQTNALTNSVQILGITAGTVSSGIAPGTLRFKTANAAGLLTDALVIDQAQSVSFPGGQTQFTGSISGGSLIKLYNQNTAGYSSLDVYDSSNSLKMAFGYANASATGTAIQGNNYLLSSIPVVFTSSNTNELWRSTTSGIFAASTGGSFRKYNTADQTTNTEFLNIGVASNIFGIISNSTGTGVTRPIQIITGAATISLDGAGSTILPNSKMSFAIGSTSGGGVGSFGNIANTGTMTSSSGMQMFYSLNPTINQTSTAGYRALWIPVFEQGIGSGSAELINAGTTTAASGGTFTSKWKVDDGGNSTQTGNITLATAGNKLVITEGTNGRVGNTTLSAGTIAITISGLTTSSRAFVTRTVASGTTLTTGVTAVCTSNTLTITADVAAGTINTADGSSYNYFIIN